MAVRAAGSSGWQQALVFIEKTLAVLGLSFHTCFQKFRWMMCLTMTELTPNWRERPL
jgi:hypothetical protein